MTSAILSIERLTGIPWKTLDPFLFCAFHRDQYGASYGTDDSHEGLGVDPKALKGRDVGSDFSGKQGWSMYHGEQVPGFPVHPHYGFETITIVNEGLVDHSDSWGATARYGQGDVQWLTTGSGICHAEMFPLVNHDKPNPQELFQLWLNLPKAKKKSTPHFAMAWADEQPKKSFGEEQGKQAHVRLVGGKYWGLTSVPPPPDSYGSDPTSELVVATIKMELGSTLTLPRASSTEINRALYFYRGTKLMVDGKFLEEPMVIIKLAGDKDVEIQALGSAELLYLQARPLNEPVIQHGPFVTNSREELMQVMLDYQRTQFGGWKWGRNDPVHPRDKGRFYSMKGKLVVAKPLDESSNSENKTEL